MRIPSILTTALCLVAWSAPGAQADTSSPVATSPAEPVAAAAAPVAPSAPVAVHDTNHTPPAEGSAQKPMTVASAVTEAQPLAAAEAEEDPVICRSRVETGTLGRKQKICMTKSQWTAQKDAARRYMKGINQSRAAQGGGQTLPPGG